MHKLRYAPGDPEEGLRAALEGMAGPGPVYVLGLGYVDKADDGAGVLVAENLRKTFPEFSFSEHDGVEGTVLDISERQGPATVFFVDATELGDAPGTVRVVPKDLINDREITTHRVAVALMAAILKRSGKQSAVICIQPGTLEFRGAVSSHVASAIDTVSRVLRLIMQEKDEAS